MCEFAKVIGEAVHMKIRSSQFNYYVRTEDCRFLIWNTLSDALLSVDSNIYRALDEDDCFALPEDIRKDLQDAGVLIFSDRNELSELEEELLLLSSGQDLRSGGYYRILTTTACNAACPYCYEKHSDVRTMDEETAHKTADFIIRHSSEKDPFIEWFGGEPLLNPGAISVICDCLRKSDICFASKIITNGSLWTDDLIEAAVYEWNLRSAQITLDGLDEEHENLKCLPAGSFRRIVRGIHELADRKIPVHIRINHFAGQDHMPLVRRILDEFSMHPIVYAYAVPGYGPGKEYSKSLAQEVFRLNMILKESGIAYKSGRVLPGRVHLGCGACDPHNYTVDPEGRLLRCTHMMSDDQCVGDVCRGAVSPEEAGFIRKAFSERCRKCVLLPVCMGGCRAAETGAVPMIQCPPFKGIIPELVQYEAKSREGTGRLSFIEVKGYE